MPTPIEIDAPVIDGTIPDETKRHIAAQLKLYDGGRVRIKLSRPKRSTKANRYYWACLNLIRLAMNDAGYAFLETGDGVKPVTSKALHQYFKRRYLDTQVMEIMGTSITLDPTTTKLDSTSFSDYLENIKNDEFVLPLGIDFEPPPELTSHKISDSI